MRTAGRHVLFGLLLVIASGCTKGPAATTSPVILRVGVGALPQQAPNAGLRQVISSLTLEPLITPDGNGRMSPRLAEKWSVSADGLTITLRLRSDAVFHDGTPVTAATVVTSLEKGLATQLSRLYAEHVASVIASDRSTITIALRRPSQFVLEALEIQVEKPGKPGIGTGPFLQPSATSPGTLNANSQHYLGPPGVSQVVVTSYPTVRAAWAELLRGNLDTLNEVNLDGLDSLQSATNVNVFSYVRHYQYAIVWGPHTAALQPPEVRRALSAAIDRDAIVREALNGHGVPSWGPVPPQHWTMTGIANRTAPQQLAKTLAARHLKFTCLVPPDTAYERVALAIKRQLAAVSVEMDLVEATQQQITDAFRNGTFDALLGDIISGPTLFRSFRFWSSNGPALKERLSSPQIDSALEHINAAVSDEQYRAGVAEYQRAIDDAPPALFIAWSERSRAVSRRFAVPTPDRNTDVLNSIGRWRPVAAPQTVSTN